MRFPRLLRKPCLVLQGKIKKKKGPDFLLCLSSVFYRYRSGNYFWRFLYLW